MRNRIGIGLASQELQKIAAQARPKKQDRESPNGVIFWLAMIFIFFILPMIGLAG